MIGNLLKAGVICLGLGSGALHPLSNNNILVVDSVTEEGYGIKTMTMDLDTEFIGLYWNYNDLNLEFDDMIDVNGDMYYILQDYYYNEPLSSNNPLTCGWTLHQSHSVVDDLYYVTYEYHFFAISVPFYLYPDRSELGYVDGIGISFYNYNQVIDMNGLITSVTYGCNDVVFVSEELMFNFDYVRCVEHLDFDNRNESVFYPLCFSCPLILKTRGLTQNEFYDINEDFWQYTTCKFQMYVNYFDAVKSYAGYQEGYSTGYTNGVSDGFNQGYQQGVGTAQQGTFLNLFNSIADTPLRFIYGLFSFDLFGTSMLVIILSLLTGIVLFGVVKKFWK